MAHTIPNGTDSGKFSTHPKLCYPVNNLPNSPPKAAATPLLPLGSLVILAIALVTLLACSSAPTSDDLTANVAAPQSDPIPSGQKIFALNCASCHGVGGEGQPNWHIQNADGSFPAPPLNGEGHTWHHADGLLYRIVRDGGSELTIPGYKSVMPAFENILSHQEIIAVLTYVKSLWEGKMSRGLFITESQAFASEHDPFPTDAPQP